MKTNKLIYTLLIGILLTSCSSDDNGPSNPDNPNLDYDYGFFVLNEGGSAGGSVSFVSPDLQNVQHDVYATENPGEELGLGLYLQSMFFHDDKAYIVSNGSNLITVVDRNTFELQGKVDNGLDVPRYGVVLNGKAYVTNQAGFQSTADDYVAVINLETLEVEENISVAGPVEFIEEHNGKLYIQSAAYGSGNQISVLDPTTDQVETISVSDGLNSIDIEGNKLYSLSATAIEKVDLATLDVSEVAVFPANTFPAKLEVEDGEIYYTVGKDVFSMPLQNPEIPTEALFTYESTSEFGVMYGFEVEDGRVFIADAGDFASSGSIHVYDEDGTFIEQIEVGIAPNGFYFND